MKGLVKAIFLTSTLIVATPALSTQDSVSEFMLSVAKEQGSQGQRIITLEQTTQGIKDEIHEFKESVKNQFDEVKNQFNEIKQIMANSTTEANARFANMTADNKAFFKEMFERYSNQTNSQLSQMATRLNETNARVGKLEQPWGTNVFSSLVTDPLMVGASFCTYLGVSLLVPKVDANKKVQVVKPGVGTYILLGTATLFSAQALWNAFSPPVQYALVSCGAFVMTVAGGVYKLSENPAGVVDMVQKISGLAGLVTVSGFMYKAFDTTSVAEKKKN